MTYYLLLPGDAEVDVLNEANLLGEASFGVFWAGTGLRTLMHLVADQPEVLPLVRIKTDKSTTLGIEEFLTAIKNLKVRIQ